MHWLHLNICACGVMCSWCRCIGKIALFVVIHDKNVTSDVTSVVILVTLSSMFPDTLMVGMEIRVKVSDYVMDRIRALRTAHSGQYRNIACIRTNCMKYLPNFFRKGQVWPTMPIYVCVYCCSRKTVICSAKMMFHSLTFTTLIPCRR